MGEKIRGEDFPKDEVKPSEKEDSFEKKERGFFIKTGLSVRNALKMHKEAGLWSWDKELDRSWKNVSEHCLVETARAEVFADKLGFPEDLKKDLTVAAALHDFFKREEMKDLTASGMTWDAVAKTENRGHEFLSEKGFSDRVLKIVGSISFDPSKTKELLEKEVFSQEDLASLVMVYIDFYTQGSEWTKPSEIGEDGKRSNALDWRMDNAKIRYKDLSDASREYFNGESVFEVNRKTYHLVERIITEILNQKNNGNIIPEDLPYSIDQEIKAKIEAQP